MDARRLAFLAAVLAALTLGATFLYWRSVRDTTEAPFEGVRPDAVAKLAIDRQGAEIVLEREGGAWRLTAPVVDAADPNPVNDALTAVLQMRLGAEVASDPSSYEDYAVHEASATRIRVYAAGRAAPVFDAFFGRGGIGYSSVYVRLAGEKPVYLATGLSPRQVGREALEFRDRSVTRIDRASVSGISWRSPKLSIEIARSTHGWSVSGAEISPDKVDAAVDMILGLRAAGFEDRDPPPSQTLLARPAVSVEIRAPARSTRLAVGDLRRPKAPAKGAPPPSYRYAEVAGRRALLLIAIADLEAVQDLLSVGARSGH